MRTAKNKFASFGKPRFNSQEVVDALRNTITVIVPIVLFFYLGKPLAALGIGTGSLLICLTDLPGSRSEKLYGALWSIPIFFVVATLTALFIQNIAALAIITAVLTFLLLLFVSLGQRMGAIGTMSLCLVAFTIGHHPLHPFIYGCFVAIGGIWYFMVSLAQSWLFRYHALKGALVKTRRDTAALMRLRATGYDFEASLSGFNAKNIKLHLKLTSDHELIRRLLLGDKFNVNFEHGTAKQLLKESILLIDLYEQVNAVHYDYNSMRKELQGSGALELIKNAIEITADKLQGNSIDSIEYDQLVFKLANIGIHFPESRPLINGIASNLRQIGALVFALDNKKDQDIQMQVEQFPGFLTEGAISFKKLSVHLTYSSQIFRFALRMSLLMLVVVFFIGFLPKGSYGYWLPITLIVISRPSFGMTMKRNIERLIGTQLGLILGWCLHNMALGTQVQLGIAIIAMFVFFVFLSVRYWISAMGITLAVVLCLSIYHGHSEQIVSQRLLFTILGCVLGLVATFLFPVNHPFNLKTAILNAISSNRDYLMSVVGQEKDVLEIKLARKQAYLALSALNEAIAQAAKEPKWKRAELKALKQIELLCFQLNALAAASPLMDRDSPTQVIANLDHSIERINGLHHLQVLTFKPLERLDGPLAINNVSAMLGYILSS